MPKTFKQFLSEAVVRVDDELTYIEAALKQIKSEIVDRGLHYYDIEEILNDNAIMKAFHISFTESPQHHDDFDSSNNSTNIGLDGAEFDPSTNDIRIFTLRGLADSLDDKYKYDEFIDIVLGSIGHELTHREQIYRSKLEKIETYDDSTLEKYISDKFEIMAYAGQAVHEILTSGAGEHPSKILAKLRTSKGVNLFVHYSRVLQVYRHTFDSDHPIWKRFIKYMVEYLEGKDNENNI